MIEVDRIQKQLNFLRLKIFEQAEKPGKWLSYKLRAAIDKRYITRIKDEKGEHTNEKEIQHSFSSFYKKLYTPDQIQEKDVDDFLDNIHFEEFSESEQQILKQEITKQEIQKAINALQLDKAPGPDGLSGKVYQKLQQVFMQPLLQLMNSSIKQPECHLPE